MTNKYIIMIIFMIFIISQIYLTTSYSEIQFANDHQKIIIIRADDIDLINPAIIWLSDVIIKKNITATYAVIPEHLTHDGPETSRSIQYLSSLSRDHFELSVHGFTHENFSGLPYQDQYDLIKKATDIMTSYFYRPLTFVAPYNSADENTVKALTALGYHTISAYINMPLYSINQLQGSFEWETNWTNSNGPDHHNLGEFENTFDKFYNSDAKVYLIILHPSTLNNVTADGSFVDTDQKMIERMYFEKSIDYMKGKNVEFLTIEQYYDRRNSY
jgi:peptidoglycan/xylan/chitin deacetylase (PgdA/CDA1 family)